MKLFDKFFLVMLTSLVGGCVVVKSDSGMHETRTLILSQPESVTIEELKSIQPTLQRDGNALTFSIVLNGNVKTAYRDMYETSLRGNKYESYGLFPGFVEACWDEHGANNPLGWMFLVPTSDAIGIAIFGCRVGIGYCNAALNFVGVVLSGLSGEVYDIPPNEICESPLPVPSNVLPPPTLGSIANLFGAESGTYHSKETFSAAGLMGLYRYEGVPYSISSGFDTLNRVEDCNSAKLVNYTVRINGQEYEAKDGFVRFYDNSVSSGDVIEFEILEIGDVKGRGVNGHADTLLNQKFKAMCK